MAVFKGNELEEINAITSISDLFSDNISKKVKISATFQKFLKEVVSEFTRKNDSKLNTNIVGRQIILNKSVEDSIFDIFDLERSDIKESILESPYFKKFGKELSLTDQLVVAIPLLLASLEYHRIGKDEESKLLFLFAHFKPYSSRESYLFKFGVDEGRMLYTVEKTLTDRFDLKKYRTVMQALTKRSESSWLNYISPLKKDDVLSDRDLHVIYNSGIATRVNDFLAKIYDKYKDNAGKSLDFDATAIANYDKDSDSYEYSSSEIESDTAVKMRLVNSILSTVSRTPVDKSALQAASKFAFGTGSSNSNVGKLEFAISEIVDGMFSKLDLFFKSLIGAFLTDVSLGRKIEIGEIKSPVFLKVGIDILTGKKSHLVNKDMLTVREIFNEMLELHMNGYADKKDTYKYMMKKALAAYWIFLISKVSKGR